MLLITLAPTMQCTENKELHEKVNLLEQRLNAVSSEKSSPSCSNKAVSGEYADELKKKIQSQVNL